VYKIRSIEIKKKLNKVNIEEGLKEKGYNEYDLAVHYIPNFKGFGIPVRSNLRTDDTNNSLVAVVINDKLMISDFGLKTGMNIYNYLIEKENLPNTKSSFYKVLDLIRKDFNLKNIESCVSSNNIKKTNKHPIKHNVPVQSSLPVKIEVRRQRIDGKIHWTKEDIKYWKQYGISIKKLEEKKIAPLNAFWITNYSKGGMRIKYDVSKELCYVYPFFRNESGLFMYKIYLPQGFRGNKDFKWVGNVNRSIIQNIEHIPNSGDLLILQSSYKDIMLMEELFPTECYTIASNGEGMWFKIEEWRKLRKNWKKIIYFGNNDYPKNPNPGLEFARKHSNEFKIPFITTPDGCSDISDFYKEFGLKKTKKFLTNCFENIKLIT
jgi:hypothetical protein